MVVNVHEAKTHLSRLLHRVAAGEDVVIAHAGVPVARLVPIQLSKSKRELGIDKGKIWISDDFDAPSPEIEALFGGERKNSHKRAKSK
jgi:prevent-host-death family protein